MSNQVEKSSLDSVKHSLDEPQTITVLGHTFSRKLFVESLRITLEEIHTNDDPLFEKKFMGMTFRKNILSIDSINYSFSYKNDEICGFIYYMDENEIVLEDMCKYFTHAFTALKPHKCESCSVNHYVTTDQEFHCHLCMNALSDMDVTLTKTDSICYICQEPLKENVGAFPCSLHYGHIPCIANYHRNNSNKTQVCPIRCKRQEITIEFMHGDFSIGPDNSLVWSEHQTEDASE